MSPSVNAKNFFCHLVDFCYPQSLDAVFINTFSGCRAALRLLSFSGFCSFSFVSLLLQAAFVFDRHVGPAFLCPLVFYSLQSVWDMYPLLEMNKKVVPVFLSTKRNGRNTIDCNKRFASGA